MVRKREKTETVGTGFGMVVVAAGGAALAGDGLVEAEVVRCEELLFWESAGRVEEFSGTAATEARLVSGC